MCVSIGGGKEQGKVWWFNNPYFGLLKSWVPERLDSTGNSSTFSWGLGEDRVQISVTDLERFDSDPATFT